MKKLGSIILAVALAATPIAASAGEQYYRPHKSPKVVTNTEYVSEGGGDPGIGMLIFTGFIFLAAICQKEAGLPEAEKSPFFTELCKKGELPDPFESYAQ